MKIGVGAKRWEYGNIFSLPIAHSEYLIKYLGHKKPVNDETKKNAVRICVEASIKAISQHKEMFNCGISSIDVGEGGERWKKSYQCKQLLPLLLWGLSVFAQSNLIKALCPAP